MDALQRCQQIVTSSVPPSTIFLALENENNICLIILPKPAARWIEGCIVTICFEGRQPAKLRYIFTRFLANLFRMAGAEGSVLILMHSLC